MVSAIVVVEIERFWFVKLSQETVKRCVTSWKSLFSHHIALLNGQKSCYSRNIMCSFCNVTSRGYGFRKLCYFLHEIPLQYFTATTQKMKFSIKYFFSKCDQIRRKLRIWSHLLKKSLMENFIFCAVCLAKFNGHKSCGSSDITQLICHVALEGHLIL